MDDHRMTESYLRWRRNALCTELAKLPPETQHEIMDKALRLIRNWERNRTKPVPNQYQK